MPRRAHKSVDRDWKKVVTVSLTPFHIDILDSLIKIGVIASRSEAVRFGIDLFLKEKLLQLMTDYLTTNGDIDFTKILDRPDKPTMIDMRKKETIDKICRQFTKTSQ